MRGKRVGVTITMAIRTTAKATALAAFRIFRKKSLVRANAIIWNVRIWRADIRVRKRWPDVMVKSHPFNSKKILSPQNISEDYHIGGRGGSKNTLAYSHWRTRGYDSSTKPVHSVRHSDLFLRVRSTEIKDKFYRLRSRCRTRPRLERETCHHLTANQTCLVRTRLIVGDSETSSATRNNDVRETAFRLNAVSYAHAEYGLHTTARRFRAWWRRWV